MEKPKPTIIIDFDGVIHSYDRGWQGGEIYGTLTTGFVEWALEAQKYFRLAVYSTRSSDLVHLQDMIKWCAQQLEETGVQLWFPTSKPPAILQIDDRAVTFTGNWKDFSVPTILAFKTWQGK